MDKLLYTVPEVMAATGLSRSTLYDLIRSGALRSVKVGRCRRVSTDDLRSFIEQLPPEVAA